MRGRERRKGFASAELVVGLCASVVVVATVLGAWTSTRAVAVRVDRTVDAGQRRHLANTLLRDEVERVAHRGNDPSAAPLVVVRGREGRFGDAIEVVTSSSRDAAVRRSFFAGLDGEGRPNLYARTEGAVRQPWVLGVERLDVVRAWIRGVGWTDDLAGLVGREDLGRSIEAVEVELVWHDDVRDRLVVSTVRAGGVDVRESGP